MLVSAWLNLYDIVRRIGSVPRSVQLTQIKFDAFNMVEVTYLTFFMPMYFSIDIIESFIHLSQNGPLYISKGFRSYVFLSLKIDFVLANSVDPD